MHITLLNYEHVAYIVLLLSQMYGEFAEPFDLYECQLAIIHCGSHDDTALIESLWQNIIDKGE